VGGFLLHALRGLGYVPSLQYTTTVPPDDVLRGLCEVEKVERRGRYLTGGLGVVLSLSSKSVFSPCRPQYQSDRRTFWPVSNRYVCGTLAGHAVVDMHDRARLAGSDCRRRETGVIPRGCWRHPHNAADARRRIKQEYIDPGVSQTVHDQAPQ
jgi:hypothetical protein